MTRYSCGWDEDIDLNAAVGALALVKGQDHLIEYVDTDTMKLLYDSYWMGLYWQDETVGGLGGYIQIVGEERKYRFGKMEMATDPPTGYIRVPRVFLPAGTKLKCVGNQSGTGAEQHVVLLDLEAAVPMPPSVSIGSPEGAKAVYCLGLKTGTLIVQTISGSGNVLGQVVAYEDTEEEFGEDDTMYCLYGLIPSPGGAGQGICGVRVKGGPDILYPAIMAAAQSTLPYYLPEPLVFRGNSGVPLLVGAGVATTSTQFGVMLARF